MKKYFIPYDESKLYNRKVVIDEDLAEELITYLEKYPKFKKKFDYIVFRILEQQFPHFVEYEPMIDLKLSEMRIFPNGQNARIYCKEVQISNGTFYVIAAKFLEKKRDVDKGLIQILKAIEKYEYIV